MESRRKHINDPTSCQGDDVKRFISTFTSHSITIEKGLRNVRSDFSIDIIFEYMSWSTLYHLKNLIYSKLIRIFFFANINLNVEPMIIIHF